MRRLKKVNNDMLSFILHFKAIYYRVSLAKKTNIRSTRSEVYKKNVFWKYAANLQEKTYAEMQFQ